MRLSEIKQILAAEGIRLTKSLGQNFLHDANQLRRIAESAELKKTDKVLEIGPGLGPLTELLVEQAGEVLAIEKDARLVRVLQKRFNVGTRPGRDLSPNLVPSPNETGPDQVGILRLIHDDALECLRREPHDWNDWKLVANLPYSVASPILAELAQGPRGPQRMVATLQIEVAKRLMAQPGSPDYGLLTLLVQLDYEPRGWFKIPASCFFPEPDVDSACICLVRRPQALLPAEQHETFARVLKRSFSQRRKMMFKLLKADWPERELARVFEQLGLAPQARAETVSLEQFVRLTRGLAAHSGRE